MPGQISPQFHLRIACLDPETRWHPHPTNLAQRKRCKTEVCVNIIAHKWHNVCHELICMHATWKRHSFGQNFTYGSAVRCCGNRSNANLASMGSHTSDNPKRLWFWNKKQCRDTVHCGCDVPLSLGLENKVWRTWPPSLWGMEMETQTPGLSAVHTTKEHANP